MKRIGLTGGIGAGKSTVAEIFRTLSIPIFEADKVSRLLLSEDSIVIQEVKALLGENMYKDGEPDRATIAQIVFNNPEKLKALNEILHPAVFRAFDSWYHALGDHNSYCLKEAAILFESGGADQCDEVICVTSPLELRLQRVMERDGVTREEVVKRTENQLSAEEVAAKSDHIIVNDGVEALIPQVLKIHGLLS